jgi:hypothetical protein
MTETLSIESPQEPKPGARFPWLALVVVVLIAAGGLYFYFSAGNEQHPAVSSSAQPHLSFGPPEQAYAPNVRVENLALSKNENFLNQEVTTLSGEVANAGGTGVRDVEITVEFFDELHQIVLRETRALFTSSTGPIAPRERREFEISFEHIPTSWNTEAPTVRVTGLLLASARE